MSLTAIEIVEDRTAQSSCSEGFLTLKRLMVRNQYADGTMSAVYPCDVLHRRGSDAVVAVLYRIAPDGRIQVLLREAPRVPIYLRKHATFVHPDPREYLVLMETVAGMVEPSDPSGQAGLAQRAAAEALEETGLELPIDSFLPAGGETFASPGTGDEKLYFQSAPAPLEEATGGTGDGSVMEEWGRPVILDLREAIRRTRSGEIPDMKTEVALLRLADQLGYLPQLDCYVRELPSPWTERYSALGVTTRV